MKFDFTLNKENSFTETEVQTIKNVISELKKEYPLVRIDKVGDYYNYKEDWKDSNFGIWEDKEYAIYLNSFKKSNFLDPQQLLQIRETFFKTYNIRKKYNILNLISDKSDICSLEEIIYHEFGHAIDTVYGLSENQEIIDLYKSIDKEMLSYELRSQAKDNISEFIACAFEESCFEKKKLLSVDIINIIDKVVKEK